PRDRMTRRHRKVEALRLTGDWTVEGNPRRIEEADRERRESGAREPRSAARHQRHAEIVRAHSRDSVDELPAGIGPAEGARDEQAAALVDGQRADIVVRPEAPDPGRPQRLRRATVARVEEDAADDLG